MKLQSYLLSMTVATLLCWVSWVLVLFMVNPDTANTSSLWLFYASLSMALIGTGAIFGFVVRFIFLKHQLAWRSVLDAFRQSFLFTLLMIVSLILLSHNLFSWVNSFFLMAGLTILEYFLVSYRHSR